MPLDPIRRFSVSVSPGTNGVIRREEKIFIHFPTERNEVAQSKWGGGEAGNPRKRRASLGMDYWGNEWN